MIKCVLKNNILIKFDKFTPFYVVLQFRFINNTNQAWSPAL